MPNAAGEAIIRGLMMREAIASVSLSHDESCNCEICRAGRGDEGAMEKVALASWRSLGHAAYKKQLAPREKAPKDA